MANEIALLLLGATVVSATSAGAAIGVYVGGGGPLLDGGAGADGGSAASTPTVTPGPSPGRPGSIRGNRPDINSVK